MPAHRPTEHVPSPYAPAGGETGPPSQPIAAGADEPWAGARRRPSPVVMSGAVGGGVLGALAFGPIGAVAGMAVGAAVAFGTIRHFSAARPR